MPSDLCRSLLVSVLTGSRFSLALHSLRVPAVLFLLSLLPGRRFTIPAVVILEGILCGFCCALIPVRSALGVFTLAAMLFQSLLGSFFYAGAAMIRDERSGRCFLLLSLAYFAVCLLDCRFFWRRLAMLLAFYG